MSDIAKWGQNFIKWIFRFIFRFFSDQGRTHPKLPASPNVWHRRKCICGKGWKTTAPAATTAEGVLHNGQSMSGTERSGGDEAEDVGASVGDQQQRGQAEPAEHGGQAAQSTGQNQRKDEQRDEGGKCGGREEDGGQGEGRSGGSERKWRRTRKRKVRGTAVVHGGGWMG